MLNTANKRFQQNGLTGLFRKTQKMEYTSIPLYAPVILPNWVIGPWFIIICMTWVCHSCKRKSALNVVVVHTKYTIVIMWISCLIFPNYRVIVGVMSVVAQMLPPWANWPKTARNAWQTSCSACEGRAAGRCLDLPDMICHLFLSTQDLVLYPSKDFWWQEQPPAHVLQPATHTVLYSCRVQPQHPMPSRICSPSTTVASLYVAVHTQPRSPFCENPGF